MSIGRTSVEATKSSPRFKLPFMTQKTLHVSGLLLATGILTFDLAMPPRFGAVLIYLFVIVLGLRRSLANSKRFLKCALECLNSYIVILDDQGNILRVNSPRAPFADSNSNTEVRCKTGTNFFELCAMAQSEDWSVPEELAKGIRRVIANRGDEFCFEYVSQSVRKQDQRWFVVRVTRFEHDGNLHIVIAHDDITKFKQAESLDLVMPDNSVNRSSDVDQLLSEVSEELVRLES